MRVKYKDYFLEGTPSEIKEFIELMDQRPAVNSIKPAVDGIDDTISRLNSMDDTISRINSIDNYKLSDGNAYYLTMMPKEYFMKDNSAKADLDYIEKFLAELKANHDLGHKEQQ